MVNEANKQGLSVRRNRSRGLDIDSWKGEAERETKALPSYARQAKDEEMRKMADRIQARAIRRCGELLKTYDGRGRDRSKSRGTPTSASQRKAADRAGLSKGQQVTAVRLAKIAQQE